MDCSTSCFGFLRRRQVYLPTWRGVLALALAGLLLLWLLVRAALGFLSVNQPVPARILVVEGWTPDYAFEFVTNQIQQAAYDKVVVTGGPVEFGAPLSGYRTYAERGAAILITMGCSSNLVRAVPAPLVVQDRTYTAAVALRRWMQVNSLPDQAINLVTVGPHARRSRLLYGKAFGDKVPIGTFALPSTEFDSRRWYASSSGFRVVIGEILAYVYAKIFFYPKDPGLSLSSP